MQSIILQGLKTHYGKMFLKNRLKSYFTGQENQLIKKDSSQ